MEKRGMMTVLQSLKTAFESESEERHYHYDCRVCGTSFESDEPTVDTLSCPECGIRSWFENS
ncbi:endonuclease Q family protein [Haloarchaeobius sp. HME9146]|uniref:endonuclease Q family protein n=1 Tax=Haloarchaeobius sp. HME9146 TaxID=2978732 RepID=UPI0021BEFE19|nr:endonuclease Q family protein [Haloarchaeobius sp. HME9146]MCT9094417.1 endonuclease Q family protein [Haloarchaeobius sp. HME9146]